MNLQVGLMMAFCGLWESSTCLLGCCAKQGDVQLLIKRDCDMYDLSAPAIRLPEQKSTSVKMPPGLAFARYSQACLTGNACFFHCFGRVLVGFKLEEGFREFCEGLQRAPGS